MTEDQLEQETLFWLADVGQSRVQFGLGQFRRARQQTKPDGTLPLPVRLRAVDGQTSYASHK